MSAARKALGGAAGVILFVVVGGGYVLEAHVLKGDLMLEANLRPSEINPEPALPIPVQEAGNKVRIYLRSELDQSYQVRVRDPAGEVIVQETVDGARHRVNFHADESGRYELRVAASSPSEVQGRIEARVFANDRRFFAGCF